MYPKQEHLGFLCDLGATIRRKQRMNCDCALKKTKILASVFHWPHFISHADTFWQKSLKKEPLKT